MDETAGRYAYRCIPLSIANASGWEILTPFSFEAVWFGGEGIDSIEVRTKAGAAATARLLASHFGHGILTFHTGWLFRTSPGWGLWVRGAPNQAKEGIVALDGLVETDWLPFPFTMNWRFTRSNEPVRFEKGEPFCFVTPAPHAAIDAIRPRIAELEEDPHLHRAYRAWHDSRAEFNDRLKRGDPAAAEAGWQRTYVHGRGGTGDTPPAHHRSKRKLHAPR